MSRPDFIHVAATELLAMPAAHQGPGHPFAQIELGRADDGAWLFAACLGVKDSAKFAGLGWWPDDGRESYPTRDAARHAAIAHMREFLASRRERPGAQRVAAWLDRLTAPQQKDLFAA